MKNSLNKKQVFSWCLYDWANSAFSTVISTFIFATYFTQYVAKNKIIGTAQWGYAIAIASLCIAILSPICGAIADHSGRRKYWLAIFSMICIISSGLLWFVQPSTQYVLWALVLVALATIGFEIGMVFYNAMLIDLVPQSYYGRVSGWAWGLGYFGGLCSLIVCLFAFVYAKPNWLNLTTKEHIRICTVLVAIWFSIFALPLFLFVTERPQSRLPLRQAVPKGIETLKQTFLLLKNYRAILFFLLARMFYTDGMNTIFIFGGIFAATQFGFSVKTVIEFGIAMNVTAGLGAILFAWLDDYIGAKNTIIIAIACISILTLLILLTKNALHFWVLALLLGVFFGPAQAASRSFMAHLIPENQRNEMFGLYALSGKVTAYFSPWLVSSITLATNNQRLGLASVLVFLITGLVLLFFSEN